MKIEKNKTFMLMLCGGILLALAIVTVLIISFFTKREDGVDKIIVEADSVRFSKEYPAVPKENMFVYKSLEESVKILKSGKGLVYLGFPECRWCQAYVKYLYEVAKDENLEEIYYTNILEDRKNSTEIYKEAVAILEKELLKDNEGNPRIYVPDITVVNSGEILGHDNETSVVSEEDGTPEEYWTEQRIIDLKARLKEMIDKLQSNTCSSCEI